MWIKERKGRNLVDLRGISPLLSGALTSSRKKVREDIFVPINQRVSIINPLWPDTLGKSITGVRGERWGGGGGVAGEG